jgi:hypothetical protein
MNLKFFEYPAVALVTKEATHVGFNTGAIRSFNGSMKEIFRFPKFAELPRSDQPYVISNSYQGQQEIRALVEHEGKVHDANLAGVFTGEKQLSDINYRGRLGMVPFGTGQGMSFKYHPKIGSLIDVVNQDVLIDQAAPCDGSGYRPGKFGIFKDTVFIAHGNYPDMRLTVKALPDGQILDVQEVWLVDDFVADKNRIYDVRTLGPNDPR